MNSMYHFLPAATVLYLASLAGLWRAGGVPPIPWLFLVGVALFFLPFAYAWTTILPRTMALLLRVVKAPWLAWGVLSAGLLGSLVLVVRHPVVALPLALFCAAHMLLQNRREIPELLLACCALALIYGTVWNVNYVVGAATQDQLLDAQALAWDLNSYGWLSGTQIHPVGMFPLFCWPALFDVMEAAYYLLFSEVFVVVLILIRAGISLVPFLSLALVGYLASAVVYWIHPLVGPCIYFPETFAAEFRDTQTFRLMQSMHASFQAITVGEAAGGYTYFVAMPSMHVAMAILMQRFLAASRVVFWVFLPANLLMALSTVYLGYHYLADLTGGIALAGVLLGAARVWERLMQKRAERIESECVPGPSLVVDEE